MGLLTLLVSLGMRHFSVAETSDRSSIRLWSGERLTAMFMYRLGPGMGSTELVPVVALWQEVCS